MARYSGYLIPGILVALSGMLIAVGLADAAAPALPRPRVFAPGSISSTVGVDCFSLTPDGKTAFFGQVIGSRIVVIMVSQRIRGAWSRAQIAPFSGEWLDQAPAVAPDGTFLVYTSNRPRVPGGKPLHGGDLWRVDRVGAGWSAPMRLSDLVNFGTHIYAPSIASNGDLYFTSADNPRHQFHIYRAVWRNGRYTKSVRLKLAAEGMHELDPAIAPDESFIVFEGGPNGSAKPDHLYIAFRKGSRWSAAVDFGAAIDAYQPDCSQLGADASTLYFTSNYTGPTDWAQRSRAQTERQLARARAWDNGLGHIWTVSLIPWLKAHRHEVP